MAGETIELATTYDPKTMYFPAILSEKFDGVPVKFTLEEDGSISAVTRQGNAVLSVDHLKEEVRTLFTLNAIPVGSFVVAEVYVPEKPFKYSSGKVRASEPCTDLVGMVFDFVDGLTPHETYGIRYSHLEYMFHGPAPYVSHILFGVLGTRVDGPDQVKDVVREIYDAAKQAGYTAEGVMVHACNKVFEAGKRQKGLGRIKEKPTLDLICIGYEEAVDKHGVPMAMVGALKVNYRRFDRSTGKYTETIVKVGAGKMSHNERRARWLDAQVGIGLPFMCEVQYMEDPSYDALRQPTFQRSRPDKSVSDVHEVN